MKISIFTTIIILLLTNLLSAQTISVSAINPLTYCAGSSVSVPFTALGSFDAGNIFTAQLSNESGSFDSPVEIGTFSSTTEGTISATIPALQSSGTGYRIRIVSSSPEIISENNGTDIAVVINSLPAITPIAIPPTICAGASSQIISGVSASKFNVSSIPFEKIPVPETAESGPSGDDVNSEDIFLPFSFNFYGSSYTSFQISTNGNIQFGPNYYDSYQIVEFPTTNVKNFIALCWADIVVSARGNTTGKIKYFIDGTAPYRKLIIDYDSCAFFTGRYSSTGFFAGQISLYETTNVIEVHLTKSEGLACCTLTVPNSAKTIGVLNSTGLIGDAAPGRNGTEWETTTPEAWRFTPPGDFTYAWTPVGSLDSTSKDTVTAAPAVTTTYNVEATNIYTGCVSKGSTTVTVNPNVTPNITITDSTGSNPTCSGSTITFNATPVNEGTIPAYEWIRNETAIVGTGSTYTTASLSNNDNIRCVLTSNASCLTTPTATSNIITVSIIPSVTPDVSITASSSGAIEPGTSVTFTAIVSYGGAEPSYQWRKNGENVGINSPTYTENSWNTGDDISCSITSNAVCANPQTVTSNVITVVLPLTLIDFKTSQSSNEITCTWQTASEINTNYFIVQRSTDGINFEDIGKVYASGNNNAAEQNYSFTDKEPGNGINYYRLKTVDRDGRFTYSRILSLNINSKTSLSIYPNPVKNNLFVQTKRSTAEKIALQITDMQGRLLHSEIKKLTSEINAFSINTSTLSKGSYILILKGERTEKKMFIKE